MGRQVDISGVSPRGLKLKILVCNLIIALICVASILALFLGNFITLKVAFVIDDSVISQIMPTPSASGEPNLKMAASSKVANIPEADRTVKLDINLSSKSMVESVTADSQTVAKNLVKNQVENLKKQLLPLIKIIAKVGVNVAIVEAVNIVKETMLADGVTEDMLDAKLAEMGIDLDVITTDTIAIVDKLFATNPDTAAIKQDVVNILDKVMATQTEEVKKQAVEQFGTMYDELINAGTDTSGVFDPMNFITGLMAVVNGGGTTSQSKAKLYFSAVNSTSAETSPDQMIEDVITGMIPVDAQDTVALVVKIIGFVILGMVAVWAYVILKILLKMFFAKNKTVRVGLPCFFSILLFSILVIAPTILLSFLGDSLFGAMSLGIKLSTMSTAFLVCFICSWVLIIFSFFYKKYRRQSKALFC